MNRLVRIGLWLLEFATLGEYPRREPVSVVIVHSSGDSKVVPITAAPSYKEDSC